MAVRTISAYSSLPQKLMQKHTKVSLVAFDEELWNQPAWSLGPGKYINRSKLVCGQVFSLDFEHLKETLKSWLGNWANPCLGIWAAYPIYSQAELQWLANTHRTMLVYDGYVDFACRRALCTWKKKTSVNLRTTHPSNPQGPVRFIWGGDWWLTPCNTRISGLDELSNDPVMRSKNLTILLR